MKELKSYISEGFFSNVGANNIVKPKDTSSREELCSEANKFK